MLKEDKIYIGVDVSKAMLDIFVLPTRKYMQFKNNEAGIQKLVKKVALFSNALVVMESTGGYEQPLAYALSETKANVCVMNPRQIRDFAKALGKLAKTDKIDAEMIALFASKIEPQPQIMLNKDQKQLTNNNARRQQLIDMITMEKNRLDKASPELRESIQRILDVLQNELERIDSVQESLIEDNPDYSHKKKILSSIKGIGAITATSILSVFPELGQLQSKQIAALAGLAPFNRDSGTLKGKRTIWGGRASVRKALYMPVLVAVRHNLTIRAFYQRLCNAGKPKMTAIIACMRKLLIIMNTMIKKNQFWSNDFLNESSVLI
ncbi:MAG: IS110 family transposase [Tatlockia sp.]|nr:IS110 family transposase [Tatlockia sp.]